MSPAVRLALCALAALGPFAGCTPMYRFTAPTARVPVSLSGVVYDPAHRLLGEGDLEPLGDVSLSRNLCQFPEANGEGVVDLSAPINEAVEHLGGEAVVDFQVAVHPPEGAAADARGNTGCLTMTSSGRVVRRAPRVISLGELGDGCARRDGRYCAELARRTVAGEGVAADVARGTALYTEACEGGAAAGCAGLAAMWRDGVGVTADAARAAAFEELACAQGAHDACGRLGAYFADASSPAYAPSRARVALEPACAAGDPGACEALGVLLQRGEGGARDASRAIQLLRRACSTRASACAHAADVYAEEHATREALSLYDLACDRGDARACMTAGDLYARGAGALASPILARRRYELACRAGVDAACGRAAPSQ